MQSWHWHQFVTYVRLKPQTNVAALESKFQNQVDQTEKALPDQHGGTDARTKFVASLSILLWLLVIFFGRAMPAFVGSTSLF